MKKMKFLIMSVLTQCFKPITIMIILLCQATLNPAQTTPTGSVESPDEIDPKNIVVQDSPSNIPSPSSDKQSSHNAEITSAPALTGGDELLLFADMPVVVSATRSEQPINWSSIPISVIDAEDIHYSGATNIYELLRYVPGMDVVKISRYRYAVGVRGFHDFICDRTLTMIDGRSADSSLFGGLELYRQPVLMEDIKQIEVVRGPGGGAWGANAFNGVINIITKKPQDCLGWFTSTTWSDFGDSYNHVRWAAKQNDWQWMVSVGYEDAKDSADAIHHPRYTSTFQEPMLQLIGFHNYQTQDFIRNWRFDGKAIKQISKETELTFGSGFALTESGDFEVAGYFPKENIHQESSRTFVRLDHQYDESTFGHIQWYGNFTRNNMPMWLLYHTRDNDLEAEHHFKWAKNHTTTLGGNFRWTNITSDSVGEQLVCANEPFNEYWAGLFAIDSWNISNRLTLESQIRGDWYSATQTDWSSRLTALYALDSKKQHVIRLGGAKAFRAPLTTLRETSTNRVALPSPPLPPNLWAINMYAPDDLENEETTSVELGYTGRLNKYATWRTDLYYQHYEKLIGFLYLGDPLGFGRYFVTADNLGGADAWGVENELMIEGKPGKLSLWYAYNDMRLKHGSSQEVRSFLPATHKAGLTGRLLLPGNCILNTNYRFSSECISAYGDIYNATPAKLSHHLDFSISRPILDGAGEIMIGVSDVLKERREPNFAVTQMTAHEIPGRMVFARMQLKF